MSTIPQNKMMEIPFNQIGAPDDENARTDLKKIEELAASIKEHGLLEPIGVLNGGEGDKPYRVKYGFRRWHALKLLKWGDKPVNCVLNETKGSGILNLVENIREDLPSIDLAQRLRDLEAGEAPGSVGESYTKKQLAEKLDMSLSHVTNLIRAHNVLGKYAKKVWRKHNVPTTIIFAWSKFKDEAEQEKVVKRWEAEFEKRVERDKKFASVGGEGDGEGGTSGKKNKKDKPEPPIVKGKNAAKIETFKDILQWKLSEGLVKGTEAKETEAQVQVLRFILGEIGKFPTISAAEMKDYKKYLEAQAAPETEETDEGDEEGEE